MYKVDIVLDKLPTDDLDNEVEACRHLKKHPLDEYLIKDLWFIVLSFLFGFTDSLVLSVPLSEVVKESKNSEHVDPTYILCRPHPYVTHFFGIDYENIHGGVGLGFHMDGWGFVLFVCGNYPLAFVDHEKSIVEIDAWNLHQRCLVQLTFDPQQMPKPTTKWFTWGDGTGDRYGASKTFYSYMDAYAHSRRYNEKLFYTNEGKIYYRDIFREVLEDGLGYAN